MSFFLPPTSVNVSIVSSYHVGISTPNSSQGASETQGLELHSEIQFNRYDILCFLPRGSKLVLSYSGGEGEARKCKDVVIYKKG